jgi:parvulin-like peptidyl-prolyl isomerase
MRRHLILAAALAVKPALSMANPASATPPAAASAPVAAGGETTYAYLSRDGGTFKAPLFAAESENLPVATIDDDAITLRELMRAIGAAHGSSAAGKQAGAKNYLPILDRLIDARLLAREARQMGIADLPEHKQAMKGIREAAGRELLQGQVLKDVRPDPTELDRVYKQLVREWKVRSVLVPNRDDVNAFVKQVKAGKKFEDLAKQLVAAKKAKGGEEAQFLGRNNALPAVVTALEQLKVGALSEPVKLSDGFAVLKVEAVRYPEDAKARETATDQALATARKAALTKYYAGLLKRYAHTDQALLKRIDFEAAKPGLAALKKDQRVISRIEGDKAITVADLATGIEEAFFHGVDSAIKEKRVNKEKPKVFDGMLSARVVPLEVKRLAIEDSTEFKERVANAETSLLFTRFIEKAVVPGINVGDPECRKYYEDHKKEYSYPTFYKLESVAFTSLKGAEGAIKQLRGGTDFKWLNANADGQVKPGDRKLTVEGTLSANGLPKELAALLAGSKKNDYRLYADEANKQYFAVHVIDVVGAKEQPFDEVKEKIQPVVYQDAMTAAVKGWATKVRNASQVKILITRIGS